MTKFTGVRSFFVSVSSASQAIGCNAEQLRRWDAFLAKSDNKLQLIASRRTQGLPDLTAV